MMFDSLWNNFRKPRPIPRFSFAKKMYEYQVPATGTPSTTGTRSVNSVPRDLGAKDEKET